MAVPTQLRGRSAFDASRSARRAATRPARVDRRRVADQHPQLVVAQEHHVVGLVQAPGLHQLAADRHQHQPDVRVRALVDVEVVVGRERGHPQVGLVGRAHLVEGVARQAVEDLDRRRLDVAAHRRDRRREVVVARDVVADEVEHGLHLFAHGRIDELVAPHGVPAELALIRLDPVGDERPPALGAAEGLGDGGGVAAVEGRAQLRVVADLVLHPPQGLDRVPVAVRGGVLQPAQQLLVDRAAGLLHHRAQVEGRRQLGEVEHPVDLPVPVVDVDRVLEQDGRLRQGHRVAAVQLGLEVGEVALHLGDEAVAPPVGELGAVDRQDHVEVAAHRGGEGLVAGDAGAVARAVLGAVDPHRGIGRDRRGVDVAVDVLGQPVDRERGAEAAEHVVAAQPPAPDVEEHRAHRVRDVEVVVDPEQPLLGVRVPGDGERVVAEELAEDLLRFAHRLTSRPQGFDDRSCYAGRRGAGAAGRPAGRTH